MIPEGSTTVNLRLHVAPAAVFALIVTVPERSAAVNVTEMPEAADSVPAPVLVHVAATEHVRMTASPTPIFVLARSGGVVATVLDVIVQGFGLELDELDFDELELEGDGLGIG